MTRWLSAHLCGAVHSWFRWWQRSDRRRAGLVRFFALCLLCLSAVTSFAEVTLPSIFSDHMVLQRDLPIHVWGMAQAGERVTVHFLGESQVATANNFGQWTVSLKPASAGGPYALTVEGSNTITYRDVLVGDVWLASGQSNMAFPLAHGENRGVVHEAEEIRAASYPRIRLLDLALRSSEYPLTDAAIRHGWVACTPETVASFSAVAYFFARDIQPHVGVPIGVIDDSWGGSPAEAWVSQDALAADDTLMPVFARRARLMDGWSQLLLQKQREAAAIAAARADGKPIPQFWHMDIASWRPAGLFNAMIAPLTPFPIKGVIWYQGESNDDPDAVPVYGALFRALITDWRQRWSQADLPFLIVQLPNFNSGATWPELREQQAQALRLRKTGMVVSIDIGDSEDIHPKNKQDVAARLALTARAVAYGEAIESSGPQFVRVTLEDSRVRVWFSHTQKLAFHGRSLRGFEVAGADQKFVPASASIDGSTVILSNPAVTAPMFARYGWSPDPDCNLYNQAQLPAAPFRAATFTKGQVDQP